MNDPEPSTIRFGIFEANFRSGELRRNGVRIRLQDQPFQILNLLLQKPGEVVTREELQASLWPADTFVDFDHSLNTAIKRLRDALGDSADSPRFVETLARRGYRFIAPVHGVPESSPPEPVSKATTFHLKHPVLWAIATFLLFIGGFAGWFLGARRDHLWKDELLGIIKVIFLLLGILELFDSTKLRKIQQGNRNGLTVHFPQKVLQLSHSVCLLARHHLALEPFQETGSDLVSGFSHRDRPEGVPEVPLDPVS